MKTYLSRALLQVKKSSIHGYGVFADQDIHPDEIIEECYVLITQRYNDPGLFNYYFEIGDDGAVVLGYGSIYNHSKHPNACYVFDRSTSICTFTATHPIKRGDEILISYGENWFSKRKMRQVEPSIWFKVRRLMSPTLFLVRFAMVMGILVVLTKVI